MLGARTNRPGNRIFFFLAILIGLAPVRGFPVATEGCLKNLVEIAQKQYPATYDVLTTLQKFAKDHNLPTKVLEVGPPNRRVNRLFVGLDASDPKLMEAYHKQFTLEGRLGPNAAGVLPLEFQFEVPDQYVTGVLRPKAGTNDNIYRWGRPDLNFNDWWTRWVANKNNDVMAYGHLIGLTADELENVKFYLAHPELRAKCKADNCVAWTSSIELGKTKQGATDDERKFLMNELGVARSMAHFEIGRRLMNAANARHGAVVVFLNGKEGLDKFKNLSKYLPTDPQIKYDSIIRGVENKDINKDAVDAIKNIPDGAHILFPIAAGASADGFTALAEHIKTLKKGVDIDLFTNGLSEAELKNATKELGNKLRVHALFLGSNLRALYRDGKVELADGNLGDIARGIKAHRKPEYKYDAILVRVAPPDAKGHYSLGPNNDVILTAIKANPKIKVIAEINKNVPHSAGDNYLTEDQITAQFVSKAALVSPPVVPYVEVEKRIGKHLGALVDNGAYLQVGIGNLFDGLPNGLKLAKRSNLKIYSEMIGDALLKVMTLGMAKRAKAGFAFGSNKLYKALKDNKSITMVPTTEVNDPKALAKLKKFDAINTALQVDLRGNANATMAMDGKAMSSPGGQLEFMKGATASPGGKAIIAIRSTAKNGTISTISNTLYGDNVTTPGKYVTHVVTEYGVADLAGKTPKEKALALIRIANPRFRWGLAQTAVGQHLITAADANEFLNGGENVVEIPQH